MFVLINKRGEKMKFNIGGSSPATIEVTNRQGAVEWKMLKGWATEKEVRSLVGNCDREMYQYHYDGYYSNRKNALSRMESNLIELKKQVEQIEFAIKVTKKKKWVKVD